EENRDERGSRDRGGTPSRPSPPSVLRRITSKTRCALARSLDDRLFDAPGDARRNLDGNVDRGLNGCHAFGPIAHAIVTPRARRDMLLDIVGRFVVDDRLDFTVIQTPHRSPCLSDFTPLGISIAALTRSQRSSARASNVPTEDTRIPVAEAI